jgi:GNAT superfamily N-acetyltransferase
MSIEVRPGVPHDLEEIAELHKASILALCAGHYTPTQLASWTQALTPDGYRTLLCTRKLFVATDGGKVRGFGVLDLDNCLINATYVSPSAARRGFGRALVEAMESSAKDHGLRQLTLHATLNAVQFYEALGFVRGERSTNRLPTGTALPCYVMTKSLPAQAAGSR